MSPPMFGVIQVGVSAGFSILRLGFRLDSPFQKAWNLQSELRKLKTSIANCLNSGWFRGDPYETWIKICNAINKAFCCSHDLMHPDASCANLHTFESEDMSSWFPHHNSALYYLCLGSTPTWMEAEKHQDYICRIRDPYKNEPVFAKKKWDQRGDPRIQMSGMGSDGIGKP